MLKRGLWEGRRPPPTLFLPCSAGAGREDKRGEGRAEVLAETPARPGAGPAADRAHPQTGEAEAGAGEQRPGRALAGVPFSLWPQRTRGHLSGASIQSSLSC